MSHDPIPASHVFRASSDHRVVQIDADDALLIVDAEGQIQAISSGLCEQLGVATDSVQGKSLNQFERLWRKVAMLVRVETALSTEQRDFGWPSEHSLLRVLPRMDVLLQSGVQGLPQILTCDERGGVVSASAALLTRPGGGLLRGGLSVWDLLPTAAPMLRGFMSGCARRTGVAATLGIRIPNLGNFRIMGLASGDLIELSFSRTATDVLSLSELIQHPAFNRTIDLMTDSVSIHDLDGTTLLINESGQRLLAGERITSSVPQLYQALAPEDRSIFAGVLAAALRGATTRATLHVEVGTGEKHAQVLATVRPIRREDGEMERLLVICHTVEGIPIASDVASTGLPVDEKYDPLTRSRVRVAGGGIPERETTRTLEQASAVAPAKPSMPITDVADPVRSGNLRFDAASETSATHPGTGAVLPQGYAWRCVVAGTKLSEPKLYGGGFDELHGFSFQQLAISGGDRRAMPDSEAERIRLAILAARETDQHFTVEFARYDRAMALRWSVVHGVVHQDPHDSSRFLVDAVTLDLDQQQRVRQEHDRQHRFLASLSQMYPQGGGFQLGFDDEGWVELLLASDPFRKLCPSLTTNGRNAGAVLMPSLSSLSQSEIDQRLRQCADDGGLVNYEFTLDEPGAQRHFLLIARADAYARRAIVNGLLIDLTDRWEMERTLLNREQLLLRIGDNLPSSFVFQMIERADHSTCFSYVSAGFERLTGISRHEVAQGLAPLLQRMSASDAMGFERRMHESARRMVALEFEFGLSSDRRDPTSFLYLCARPRPFTGGATLWEGVATDVTSRHREGEEKRKLILRLEHQVTELESVNFALSHDLKGAVLGLRGQLDLALELAEHDGFDSIVERLKRSVGVTERMWQMLAQMLELSHLERAELVLRRLPMLELVQPTLDLLDGLSEQSGVRVELETPDLEIECDVLRLQSVLVNVIGNALKFSPPGSAAIVICGRDSIDEVTISITDHGIGIDTPYLERVFGLFERIDPAAEGSGVGLALVRRVIQMHGGKVWATSGGVGHGTTIQLSLPKLGRDRPNPATLN